MGFLNRLRKATAADHHPATTPQQPPSGPKSEAAATPTPTPAPTASPNNNATSEYDRTIWRKKLKTILERLPESAHEWPILMTEASALGFTNGWVHDCLHAEFELLVRKVVSDKVVSTDEHSKLDQARKLIGLGETEAIALVDRIVTEAEEFFHRKIDRR